MGEIVLMGKVSIVKQWKDEKEQRLICDIKGRIFLAQDEMANKIICLPRGCEVIASGVIWDREYISIGCGKTIKPDLVIIDLRIK